MIEENIKIHDKLSAEIKVGFSTRKKVKLNESTFRIWLFIPNSLDVNRFSYAKADFYKDLKSNIRLTTPTFLLRDILESENSPFHFLKVSMKRFASNPTRTNHEDYEYHIKMFLSVLKSSLRDDVNHILISPNENLGYRVDNYTDCANKIFDAYIGLFNHINVPTVKRESIESYLYGEEFLCNIIEKHTFMLLKGLKKHSSIDSNRDALVTLSEKIIEYKRQKGYILVGESSEDSDRDFLYRMGLLKKFAESDLFLNIRKRRDGLLIEQLVLSIAAGISMVFATFIAFSVQQKYGNFTMPLFVALVVSYMLKDRIKELSRYYFANKIGKYFFDHKTEMNINQTAIGWVKEGMNFVSDKSIPAEIHKIRNRSNIIDAIYRTNSEKVINYQMQMHLNREKLNLISPYYFRGVNAIIRFNFSNFLRNMDNPEISLFVHNREEEYKIIKAKKNYYINLVIHKLSEEQNELSYYKISLDRNGINKIIKIS